MDNNYTMIPKHLNRILSTRGIEVLECNCCGKPINVGDKVTSRGVGKRRLFHEDCLRRSYVL